MRALACAAALAAAFLAERAAAQTATGSSFVFTIRHEHERGATTRTGRGEVAGRRARLEFDAGGESDRSPLSARTTVFVIDNADPVESLVIADDSARVIMRPARRLAEMRRMLESIPGAPQITARLVSIRADTGTRDTTVVGLPARRYRAAGEVVVFYRSDSPPAGVAPASDSIRVVFEAETFHSWAAPSAVDPFRGIQTLDVLLGATAGGSPSVTAEVARIAAALPSSLPLRSVWTVSTTQQGRTRTQREVIELTRVGNAAVETERLRPPDYPEAITSRTGRTN